MSFVMITFFSKREIINKPTASFVIDWSIFLTEWVR